MKKTSTTQLENEGTTTFKKKKYVDVHSLPFNDPTKTHKTAIVINGDKKCGFYVSLHLYLHGYTVYISCRSNTNFNKACANIREYIKQTYDVDYCGDHEGDRLYMDQKAVDVPEFARTIKKICPASLGKLKFLQMDAKDLKTVVNLANKYQQLEDRLDLLIDTGAGYIGVTHQITKDGFDLQLQTHFIAQALLSLLLTQQVNKAKGKIIFMSSVCHFLQYRYYDDFQTQYFNYAPNFIFTWFRYAMAKTLSIQYLKILAIKNPNIMCYSINPGMVINTNFFAKFTTLPVIGVVFWLFFQMVAILFGVTEEQGAISVLELALTDSSPVFSESGISTTGTNRNLMFSGKYFDKYSNEIKPSQVANNLDDSTATWINTIHLLRDKGIPLPENI